jgi:hypothetical protein
MWSLPSMTSSVSRTFADLARGHVLRAAGYVEELSSAEDFIAADHSLDSVRRKLLLSAYMAALQQSQFSSVRA